MSKGWYVKVNVPVQFHMDCNVGVTASDALSAENEAVRAVTEELKNTFDELRADFPWDFQTGALQWNRGAETLEPVLYELEAVSVTPDSDFDPDDSLKLSRKLRKKVLGILHCYYKDMRYHSTITDVSGINAVTNGTPSFDSEEELEAYLDDVHDTIEEFLSVTRGND